MSDDVRASAADAAPGCQASPSAADASSRSGIPDAVVFPTFDPLAEYPTQIDYRNDGAQIVYEGRTWEAEIEFVLPVECNEREVEEGLVWALGGGSIASDHPLENEDLFRRVDVYRARKGIYKRYTLWSAKDADGSRYGRSHLVRA